MESEKIIIKENEESTLTLSENSDYEIEVEKNAKLTLMVLEPGKIRIKVSDGAEVQLIQVQLDSLQGSDLEIELHGDESRVSSQFICLGREQSLRESRLKHIHFGKNSKSTMIARLAVQDQAREKFFGGIDIQAGSQGAEAYLGEHGLLLSHGAKIETIPALEIAHHDVHSSHAASIERVDEEKLFYLKSRGLNEKDGTELLVQGFFQSAVEAIADENFREKVLSLILERLTVQSLQSKA